jgi:hypothetical protein
VAKPRHPGSINPSQPTPPCWIFSCHQRTRFQAFLPACRLRRLLGGLSDERWFSGDSKLDGRERAEDLVKQPSLATNP